MAAWLRGFGVRLDFSVPPTLLFPVSSSFFFLLGPFLGELLQHANPAHPSSPVSQPNLARRVLVCLNVPAGQRCSKPA